MKPDMQKGLSRVFILLAVAWLAGMGWYQFQYEKPEKEEFRISLNDETEIRIDASGIKKTDKQEVQMEKLAIVVLPALLMLLVIPLGGWLGAGFKAEGK